MNANTAGQVDGHRRWWNSDAGTSVGNWCWCSNPVVIPSEVLDDLEKSAGNPGRHDEDRKIQNGTGNTGTGTGNTPGNHNDLTT